MFTSEVNYRKLAWVEFEPTTNEFRSEALTDWAIRPWLQFVLRANFVQLFQFHLLVQCSRFISVIAFVSHYICFKRNLAQIIMLAAEWIDTQNEKPVYTSLVHISVTFNTFSAILWSGIQTQFSPSVFLDRFIMIIDSSAKSSGVITIYRGFIRWKRWGNQIT